MTDEQVQALLDSLDVILQPGGRRSVSEVNIDLGISDGQLISQSKVGDEDGYTDPLAKLIVAVSQGLGIQSNAEDFVPIGFFIVNKATAKFDLEVANQSTLKPRFIVALDTLSDVETVSCFHALPGDASENLAWIAATRPTLNSILAGTVTFQDFLIDNNLANESNVTALENALIHPLNETTGQFDTSSTDQPNYLRQLGYLNHNATDLIIDLSSETSNLSLLDGEGGPGGGRRAGVPTAVDSDGEVIDLDDTDYDQALMFNQGSVTVNPDPNTSSTVLSTFFGGGKRRVFFERPSGSETFVSSLPQIKSDDFITPTAAGEEAANGSLNIDLKRLHSFAEISSLLFFVNNVNVEDRSFKTNANHDFGIIYYDQRGRHGFVNPLTTVFVPGYKFSERNGDPGSVTVNLPLGDLTPPDWAHNYKIAYARNTSVGNFVQYSSGGAFVQQIEDQQISQSNQNIYVSLNYLQEHPISYSSSFGARGLDGGMNLYKYQEGDRLRVISFDNGGGENREYVSSFEFEVVDYKLLSDTEDNPLSNDPDENQTGAFVVLKNNTSAFGFDYASVSALSDNWKKNCIIELYSPLKSAEEEDRIYYEIGETGSIEFNDEGVLTHNPATISLTKGDVWFRKVPVNLREFSGGQFKDLIFEDNGEIGSPTSNFKSVYLETMSVSDLIRSNSHSIGRPNVASESAGEVIRESSLTYSDPTDPSSKKPKYSSFNLSQINFKDLLESYGDINYIANFGEFLVVLQKDKVSMVPVNRNILSDASGNQNVIASKEVLGSPVFMDNGNGSDSPSSVVEVNSTLYFASAGSYAVCKMSKSSRGVITISDKNVASLIRDEILAKESSGAVRLVGGYDPVKEEYLITIINLDPKALTAIAQAPIQPGIAAEPAGPEPDSLVITDINDDGVIDAEDILGTDNVSVGLQDLVDAGLVNPGIIAGEGDIIVSDQNEDQNVDVLEFINQTGIDVLESLLQIIAESDNPAEFLAELFIDSDIDEAEFIAAANIQIDQPEPPAGLTSPIPDLDGDDIITPDEALEFTSNKAIARGLQQKLSNSSVNINNLQSTVVNTSDLRNLLQSLKSLNATSLGRILADSNVDGLVSTSDLLILLAGYGTSTIDVEGDFDPEQ